MGAIKSAQLVPGDVIVVQPGVAVCALAATVAVAWQLAHVAASAGGAAACALFALPPSSCIHGP